MINLLGTSTPRNMQWNLRKYLQYNKYLAYDLSKNTHYTIYTTTEPTKTHEQYHNKTWGLPKDFTPYRRKYNLMHVEHVLS
jgi:hypothetical protein